MKKIVSGIVFLLFAVSFSFAQTPGVSSVKAAVPSIEIIESIVIHPPFRVEYACTEHYEGQLKYPGDDLGSDCFVTGGFEAGTKTLFSKMYRTDGKTNEDWYSWGETVLAPFDGIVERILINPVTNQPGEPGKPPASIIMFKREDGTRMVYAHLGEISVKGSDKVTAGQPVGRVGNNGFGRMPHLHIGAWREKTPLQIRFDLRAKAKLQKGN